MKRRRTGLYLVFGDLAPEIDGPFRNTSEQDKRALALDKKRRDDDRIFRLDIDPGGKPAIMPYSNGFFMAGEEDALRSSDGR